MTVPMKHAPTGDIMEAVLLKGDIAKLTPEERVSYYKAVCHSVGLNPLTKPFEFITLNGKLQLYALRACTDQLRKINNISLEIVSRDVADEIMTVHVRARDGDGRVDEDLGSVAFPSALKGEARANAELKCVTKAKRRATLSICGLGWLDETEIADIPASAKRPPAFKPDIINAPIPTPPHDPITGEIDSPGGAGEVVAAANPPKEAAAATTEQSVEEMQRTLTIEALAREAAMRGKEVMRNFYRARSKTEKAQIDKIKPELDDLVDAYEAAQPSDDGS